MNNQSNVVLEILVELLSTTTKTSIATESEGESINDDSAIDHDNDENDYVSFGQEISRAASKFRNLFMSTTMSEIFMTVREEMIKV